MSDKSVAREKNYLLTDFFVKQTTFYTSATRVTSDT